MAGGEQCQRSERSAPVVCFFCLNKLLFSPWNARKKNSKGSVLMFFFLVYKLFGLSVLIMTMSTDLRPVNNRKWGAYVTINKGMSL